MKREAHPDALGLIFDIDGTLADTMPLHYRAWRSVLARAGFEYPEEIFYEYAGIPTAKIVHLINNRLGCNLDPVVAVEEKERAFLDNLHLVRPIEPVAAIVRDCHGKIPMSLGTGGRRDIADLTIKAVGLDGFFDIMVAAEDVANHKPAPDTFLECARRMGIAPERCQVFEDGEQGLEAGRRAGMIVTDIRPWLGGN